MNNDESGVYQLTCLDCNGKYIGQTGRFSLSVIKNMFANTDTKIKNKAMLNTFWTINTPCIQWKIAWQYYTLRKTGRMLNTLEKFHTLYTKKRKMKTKYMTNT
jgi:hypothetical protein